MRLAILSISPGMEKSRLAGYLPRIWSARQSSKLQAVHRVERRVMIYWTRGMFMAMDLNYSTGRPWHAFTNPEKG